MCYFEDFVQDLYEYFTKRTRSNSNIIRKHSKRLEQLGDVSFPLKIQNWHQLLEDQKVTLEDNLTVFDYLFGEKDIELHFRTLIQHSKKWHIEIDRIKIIQTDAHIFLNRVPIFSLCIKNVLKEKELFGSSHRIFKTKIIIDIDNDITSDVLAQNLSELRLILLQNVTSNIVNYLTSDDVEHENRFTLSLKSNTNHKILLCGIVVNEKGLKDVTTTASQLFHKRTVDMQLMAQHKYGVRIKPPFPPSDYFTKLGEGSVTLEMLQNKPHKAIKILLNDLQTANKGPSFIFYNCARLAALFKEFDHRVSNGAYVTLPSIEDVDFTLLNQPEEWELLYVYILQFPMMISTCVCDIENGNINPHYLISFLSGLSSVFSVYYRRIKILTDARQHLFAVLYARIYLLKALEQVFHTTLRLLNIDPISYM